MKKTSVYFYIPNIIGYIRVILALWGFMICWKNLILFAVLYGTSQILDAFDGWTARKLSTTLLYLLNGNVYDEYLIAIGLIMIADIGGHYFHSSS
ncbi:phosphatidylinositol synthase [Plasmodium cynomolgi strain B]|uniref:Phosphatidylinositol synthase n=1 Tax=Plasmodium cynomolgi (strain B) TaxID=1120755 RepID=K6VHH8_PLACD|nr:phosphatidylinositol synthase [Plasmodium cynomolgi strain B]GAB68822.1 phosphatidylinositol synthase [Plasmodium cynomolgi strain B]